MTTSKILAAKMGISHPKVRRYAFEFFGGIEPIRARSGVRRELSLEQAFTIFLATFLVGELGYSSVEAKKILHELDFWLKTNGLIPYSDVKKLPKKRWQIKIIPLAEGGFLYKSVEIVRNFMEKDEESGRKLEVLKISEDFITRIPVDQGVSSYQWRERILPISLLLGQFTVTMGD